MKEACKRKHRWPIGKTTLIVCAVPVSIFVALIGLSPIFPPNGWLVRTGEAASCRRNLHLLGNAIRAYGLTNAGYPSELRDLCPLGSTDNPVLYIPPVALWCPGRINSRFKDGGEGTDYIYIRWPVLVQDRDSEYPLVYDRRLSNHDGIGINITTTSGRVFWDRNGKWLRKFVRKHPEFNIPLPEGMETFPNSDRFQ